MVFHSISILVDTRTSDRGLREPVAFVFLSTTQHRSFLMFISCCTQLSLQECEADGLIVPKRDLGVWVFQKSGEGGRNRELEKSEKKGRMEKMKTAGACRSDEDWGKGAGYISTLPCLYIVPAGPDPPAPPTALVRAWWAPVSPNATWLDATISPAERWRRAARPAAKAPISHGRRRHGPEKGLRPAQPQPQPAALRWLVTLHRLGRRPMRCRRGSRRHPRHRLLRGLLASSQSRLGAALQTSSTRPPIQTTERLTLRPPTCTRLWRSAIRSRIIRKWRVLPLPLLLDPSALVPEEEKCPRWVG